MAAATAWRQALAISIIILGREGEEDLDLLRNGLALLGGLGDEGRRCDVDAYFACGHRNATRGEPALLACPPSPASTLAFLVRWAV